MGALMHTSGVGELKPKGLQYTSQHMADASHQEASMPEPHLLDRQRLAFCECTNARCFSGVVVDASLLANAVVDAYSNPGCGRGIGRL